ncbi:hypothetical protein ANTPLA_LOCUS4048 [Anthophora plagiata]
MCRVEGKKKKGELADNQSIPPTSSGALFQRHVTTDYVNTAFSAIFFHGKAVCKTHVANACSWPLRERLRSFRFDRFYHHSSR